MATDLLPILQTAQPIAPPRLWKPKRVYITPAAADGEQSKEIADRAARLGSEIIFLKNNRIPRIEAENDRKAYAEAKQTLAVVTAPPGKLKLQPIPPSADWQFHLAEGCPAHCQYCYLAGSLSGPPITRVYANVTEILANLPNYLGTGKVTSRSKARSFEGTTFEASCYTDPLGIEHLTGFLAKTIRWFGEWDAPVQLRWTTKFDNVEPLLSLPHGRKTRARFSVNADPVAHNFEGGTPGVAARLQAMRRMALAGYPVGLTIAPIMPIPNWQDAYRELIANAAVALQDVENLDLTAELITHRFTPGSKEVLLNWYPRTPLEMDETTRAEKRTKFGSLKYVYPSDSMKAMRGYMESLLKEYLPAARVLYWT